MWHKKMWIEDFPNKQTPQQQKNAEALGSVYPDLPFLWGLPLRGVAQGKLFYKSIDAQRRRGAATCQAIPSLPEEGRDTAEPLENYGIRLISWSNQSSWETIEREMCVFHN